MAEFYPAVGTWIIPTSALESSLTEMRRDGTRGAEGVALWLGRRIGADVHVTHVVCLRGPGVIREPAFLSIDAAVFNDVADVAIQAEALLVGQIHSHGPGYMIDLSLTDREYGVKAPHYLSLVAPDYAMRGETRITDCSVNVFEAGAYRRMRDDEIARRIVIAPDMHVDVVVVGE